MPIRVQLEPMLKAREWTISRLAQETGITVANIWRLTRNKTTQVQMKTLDAICRALECQPGDFLVYEAQLELPLSPPVEEGPFVGQMHIQKDL